ncbi:hydrolase-like protein [Podospora australis]|uniref:Hydrolase-like protein n=1 Tax=Podospora australis TaxID=1536484 RepID=A0AAN7AP92_9PEZI|nr:hydrolase-like protein [Podospora australis]
MKMSHEPQAEGSLTPTFKGRLQLQDFMFKETTQEGQRKSPRLLSRTSSAAPSPPPTKPSPSKPKSPLKRTHIKLEDDDPSSPVLSAVSSPAKRPRSSKSSSYAPPSTYAHLPHLPDAILPNLLILFIGLNPGIQTARTQHAYAHPTNLFWRLLYSSGITPRLVPPQEDRSLPSLYQLGFTNIVSRPSRNGAELSKAEMDAGVEILEEKVRRYKPEVVCVVGKSIWESLWRVRHGKGIKKEEFRYGWQEEGENMGVVPPGEEGGGEVKQEEGEEGETKTKEWKGARVFVATSTSGLAATLKPKEKEEIWKELGDWTVQRRAERAAAASVLVKEEEKEIV